MVTDIITLAHFTIEEQRRLGVGSGDFTSLLNDLSTAFKIISREVNRGNLVGGLGSAGSDNVQGEQQKKLDIISNDAMIHALQSSGHLAGMASEEMDDIFHIPSRYQRGKYLLMFDPLDGSSNIDVNGTVGTIFSVLRAPDSVERPTVADFLQPGTSQVAAGYTIYGPSTVLALTYGSGVHTFTLDWTIGSFVLSQANLRVPETTDEFAINASRLRYLEPPVRRYVDECIAGKDGPRGRNFNMRWTGSMVADIHRILLRGGIFIYALDSANKRTGGKLRLMYEANPMAMIMEQAGGMASTGRGRIMELVPENLHQRVPVIAGSAAEVDRVIEYHMQDQVKAA
ncbi:MAG: class 1 fructose-bisphosphatase [Rhodospirillaceae bacterium]|nr:class 1 fructose-bisphosphatase [Rhodospirillaceae bacterium]MCA8934159.1 class 1 fructose-bisphosphatase [Rhodospirillaceae bacterium]